MNVDNERVDDVVLALLYLTSTRGPHGVRAWKGIDIAVLRRLHAKGYISDPHERKPTVRMSEEGASRSEELCTRLFGTGM